MTAASLIDLEQTLGFETEAATDLVAGYAEKGIPWDEPMPAAVVTLGAAQTLANAARDLVDRDAGRAADLARFALVILRSLRAGRYPGAAVAQAEANTLKELATAHRTQSRHDAGLRALAAADRVLAPFPGLAYERTIISLARAISLAEANKLAEARRELEAVRPVFEELQDDHRLGQCLQLEGMLAFRQGDLALSRSRFQEALRVADRQNDVYSIGSINNNLGLVLLDLGEPQEAAAALHCALAVFDDLGLESVAAHPRWTIGRLLLANGKPSEAAEHLRKVRTTFLVSGRREEAGLAGLDQADALLSEGRISDAHRVTHEVIAEFDAAGLSERRQLALEYLRDLVATAALDVPRVRHVRAYLAERETHDLFVPLSG
jgi:tetratricopeptide (TPR) repeat protein